MIVTTKGLSERFYGKNDLLLPATVGWVLRVCARVPGAVACTVGDVACDDLQHFQFNSDDHCAKFFHACKCLSLEDDDVCVLAQVTSPHRESWLLEELIKRVEPGKVAQTGYEDIDHSWRRFDACGRVMGSRRNDSPEIYCDGALYATYVHDAARIFDKSQESNVLVHRCGGDVDYPFQRPRP